MFDENIKYIKGKLYCEIKLLGHVCRLLDIKNCMIYKTLFLPVLDYFDFIYHGTSAINKETFQKLQNCASIFDVHKYTNTYDTHLSLNMGTLDDQRKNHFFVQMFKFLNDLGHPACRDMFTIVSNHHEVYTRSSVKIDLVIPKLNLTLAQRNMRYQGVKAWKEIPEEIKVMATLDAFKKAIMNVFLAYLH